MGRPGTSSSPPLPPLPEQYTHRNPNPQSLKMSASGTRQGSWDTSPQASVHTLRILFLLSVYKSHGAAAECVRGMHRLELNRQGIEIALSVYQQASRRAPYNHEPDEVKSEGTWGRRKDQKQSLSLQCFPDPLSDPVTQTPLKCRWAERVAHMAGHPL